MRFQLYSERSGPGSGETRSQIKGRRRTHPSRSATALSMPHLRRPSASVLLHRHHRRGEALEDQLPVFPAQVCHRAAQVEAAKSPSYVPHPTNLASRSRHIISRWRAYRFSTQSTRARASPRRRFPQLSPTPQCVFPSFSLLAPSCVRATAGALPQLLRVTQQLTIGLSPQERSSGYVLLPHPSLSGAKPASLPAPRPRDSRMRRRLCSTRRQHVYAV